jgi:tripartite-type tricarboxylate transporter receptor subunit TctC
VAFYGIYGPKGLPKDVVTKVHDAVKKTLDDPKVKARIEETGSTIIANTPEQFAQQIKAEYEIYKSVAETQKLKPE